jgi:hypothetical protein
VVFLIYFAGTAQTGDSPPHKQRKNNNRNRQQDAYSAFLFHGQSHRFCEPIYPIIPLFHIGFSIFLFISAK